MRPRSSETVPQPLQAQAAPASSNYHHQLHHSSAPAPPPLDAHHEQHAQQQHHREPSQHQHPQLSTQSTSFAQATYSNSDSLYYHPAFPVIPSSYYHAPNTYPHDQYDDYEDYDDQDEVDDDDDEDMDISDSDGGAPLDHVMSVTSVLSPMPGPETGINPPESYPASPAGESFSHATHDVQLPPADPPAHMVNYWSISGGPAFLDPTGPIHPTPLDITPFHPMLHASGSMEEDDDDDDDDVFYPSVAQQLQPFQPAAIENDEAVWQATGPPAISNLHPNTLGPENPCLSEFLKGWAWRNRYQSRGPRPGIRQLNEQAARKLTRIQYEALEGDRCDVQGIDWKDLGVSRAMARERRVLDYKNYTNRSDSDVWQPHLPDRIIKNTENFFRFRRMDIRQNVHLAHFQLRNVLACSGRSRAFYPGQRVVHQINPVSGQSEVAMDLNDMMGVQISTLDANCGMLIAGTFNGEYCMRNIHSQEKKYTEGQITGHISGITNHLQIHESRTSAAPLAAFASNDQGFRVLDVATEKFVLDTQYCCPINCTALSADRRLRVMVGDNYNVLIANAETGDILQELGGHRDYGFACDWSDNGWTVATGFQDMSVKIWDARKWTNSGGMSYPLTTIRSEMAGVRSLRFSPTGSGPSVLVAAEEADFINIIDIQTLAHKQTFNIFGEIGGVEFTNDGQDLNILCMDRTRGGLIQLERCDLGHCGGFELANDGMSLDARWKTSLNGMPPHSEKSRRPKYPAQRERRVDLFDELEPF